MHEEDRSRRPLGRCDGSDRRSDPAAAIVDVAVVVGAWVVGVVACVVDEAVGKVEATVGGARCTICVAGGAVTPAW